jgi:hypothetical protein
MEIGGTANAIEGQIVVDDHSQISGAGSVLGAVTNNGKIEANGGSLTITGNVSGTGALQSDAGATLTLNGASNGQGSAVDNGVLIVGAGHSLAVSGNVTGTGTLQTNAGAVLTLNGAANSIGTLLDNGTVNVGASHSLTVTGTATVGGTLHLNGGTLQAGTLSLGGTGVLLGSGTVNDKLSTSGKIEANGGALTVTSAVTGGGRLQADSGATLNLNGAANTAASVLDNGTLNLGASHSLDVTGSVNPASTGIFVLTNASLLEVAADTGASNKINFLGTSGDKLVVNAVAHFGTNVGLGTYTGPLLENFGTPDSIDLKNLVFASATIGSYTPATGLLQLHSGATKATLLFQNSSLGSGSFHIGADSGTGTLITHS